MTLRTQVPLLSAAVIVALAAASPANARAPKVKPLTIVPGESIGGG